MKSWFQRWGYTEDVINTEMKKVIFNGNFGKSSNKSKGVTFVLTYHPLLKKVNYIIKKHIHLLCMNEEVKKVFQPGPMVSFQSPRNLSNYLVRAKIYPMEKKTKSCKCKGNRCQVCINVSKTETFTSTVTHTSYKINHSFDCNDKCLIYFLKCKTILSSMLVVPEIVSDIVGAIINVMTENMREVRLVCNKIFLNILIVKGIMGYYMMFQLH